MMKISFRQMALLSGCLAALAAATSAFAHDDGHGGYERGHPRHEWREGSRDYRFRPGPPEEFRPHHEDHRPPMHAYGYGPRWRAEPIVEAVPVYRRPAVTISLPSIVIPLR